MNVTERIKSLGIVPVVVINRVADAAPLAKALCEGGLPCAEVTFRTAAAKDAIREMSEKYPEMLIGAGTVLSVEQVIQAVEAGAKFIVSPGFDPEVVDYCLSQDIPVFPGVITPSEICQAVKRGMNVVKFFPAEPFGGAETIKALSAPFKGLSFMPTGGINLQNMESYLRCPSIIACGGSWMVKGELISSGKFDEIKKLTEQAVARVRQIRNEV